MCTAKWIRPVHPEIVSAFRLEIIGAFRNYSHAMETTEHLPTLHIMLIDAQRYHSFIQEYY